MPSDPLPPIIAALTDFGGLRVWSLLVSVFGDLAQSRGDVIEGPVLSAMMTAMDVKPEATRVALHRLRNDGWIASEKSGRTSLHSLTAHGRAESAAASPRIYSGPAEVAQDWQLIVTEDAQNDNTADLLAAGFVPLLPRVYLGAAKAPTPRTALVLHGESVPEWLKHQFSNDDLAREYRNLRTILERISSELPPGTRLSPLDTAVLRCLIVHNWRRIVLKHPDLPRVLFPDTWAGHDCRALVHALLTRFPRPSLRDIAA